MKIGQKISEILEATKELTNKSLIKGNLLPVFGRKSD